MAPYPMGHPILRTWTDAALGFHMEDPAKVDAALSPKNASKAVERALRLMRASSRRQLLVLGAEPALFDSLLKGAFPSLVVETHLPHARQCLQSAPALPLLADTSPWALLLLLWSAGFEPASTQVLQTTRAAQDQRLARLGRLYQAVQPISPPASSAIPPPTLSVAAILHPHEPGLADFFSQMPPWIHECVVVWDADQPLPTPAKCPEAAPFRAAAHPLVDGFAAQRNRALAMCTGEWILFLDADERLAAEDWAALPSLMAAESVAGWWLPRETCYPDRHHCMAGYGLWPDLQLRLFRPGTGARFQGHVHEQLHGLEGGQAIACRVGIRHEQRLQKSPADLAAKLRHFDEVGAVALGEGGHALPAHLLQDAYPIISRATLSETLSRGPFALRLPA